ncbi:MAG: hypothetical protein AAB948_03165 [Patescibacteria group bacterium]
MANIVSAVYDELSPEDQVLIRQHMRSIISQYRRKAVMSLQAIAQLDDPSRTVEMTAIEMTVFGRMVLNQQQRYALSGSPLEIFPDLEDLRINPVDFGCPEVAVEVF